LTERTCAESLEKRRKNKAAAGGEAKRWCLAASGYYAASTHIG
jgi:hypothetical protein